MEKTAVFIFDRALTPLLPKSCRKSRLEQGFNGPQSAKHLIEALGIPHTEIGDIIVNGAAGSPRYLVRDGDSIEVRSVRPSTSSDGPPRFVIDGHLGRLASGLRMLGLDSAYRGDFQDNALHEISLQQGRCVLTRDRRLLMRRDLVEGYLVRSLEPSSQLLEVYERYQLQTWIEPFTRCIRCNYKTEGIDKAAIVDQLQPLTRLYFNEFRLCPQCGQVYWEGSHVERMRARISRLLDRRS